MSMENEKAVEKVVHDVNIPDDWVCPICFVGKDEFEAVKEK